MFVHPNKSKSGTEIFQFLPDQLALNVFISLTRLQKAHRKSGNVSHSSPATTATETTTRTTLEALTPAGLATLTRHTLALSIANAAKGGLISAPRAVVGTPTTSALLKLPLLAALPLWLSTPLFKLPLLTSTTPYPRDCLDSIDRAGDCP